MNYILKGLAYYNSNYDLIFIMLALYLALHCGIKKKEMQSSNTRPPFMQHLFGAYTLLRDLLSNVHKRNLHYNSCILRPMKFQDPQALQMSLLSCLLFLLCMVTINVFILLSIFLFFLVTALFALAYIRVAGPLPLFRQAEKPNYNRLQHKLCNRMSFPSCIYKFKWQRAKLIILERISHLYVNVGNKKSDAVLWVNSRTLAVVGGEAHTNAILQLPVGTNIKSSGCSLDIEKKSEIIEKNEKTASFNLHLMSPVVRIGPLQTYRNQILKRSFDIALSLIVVVCFLSWMIPILALLIKLDSKGPVFFVQLRSGKDGKPFKCYKFRSMYVNEFADTLQAQINDSRFTITGRFMRRTSIDELPQFFNVLKNDMSVIGPRPHMLKHTEKYSGLLSNYMIRHFIKPGITGWAQVNGCRGEIKRLEAMQKRIQHDLFYLENWAFWLDIKIAIKTAWILLHKEREVF